MLGRCTQYIGILPCAFTCVLFLANIASIHPALSSCPLSVPFQIVLQCGASHQLSDFSEPTPCVYVAALTAPEACRGDEHAAVARTPVEIEQALAGLDACLESLGGQSASGNIVDSALAVATRNQCLGALSAVSTSANVVGSPPPPPTTTSVAMAADELIAVESTAIDATSPPADSPSVVAENEVSPFEGSAIPTPIAAL